MAAVVLLNIRYDLNKIGSDANRVRVYWFEGYPIKIRKTIKFVIIIQGVPVHTPSLIMEKR